MSNYQKCVSVFTNVFWIKNGIKSLKATNFTKILELYLMMNWNVILLNYNNVMGELKKKRKKELCCDQRHYIHSRMVHVATMQNFLSFFLPQAVFCLIILNQAVGRSKFDCGPDFRHAWGMSKLFARRATCVERNICEGHPFRPI